jgi:hypothetical protein
MSNRYALIYQSGPGALTLSSLWSLLAPLNLQLRHPTENAIFVLDEVGDQVAIGQAALADRIQSGRDTSFQFWFAHDNDLLCRMRVEEQVHITLLDLLGKDANERAAIWTLIERELYVGSSASTTRGLVLDEEGVTENYDWDLFFVHGQPLRAKDFRGGLPDVLIVDRSLASQIEGFSTSASERLVRLV